jgi:hypothetical protein
MLFNVMLINSFFFQFAGQWYNLAYNYRSYHPVHTCLKSNIVAAESEGQVTLTYHHESKVAGNTLNANIISQTFKPGFPGLFYGVWRGYNISTWTGELYPWNKNTTYLL